MKAVIKAIGSTTLTGFLFILIAMALGMATIVETLYDTATAQIWIYNATWLEVVYLIFSINLLINIFRFKLLKNKKIALWMFHISFLLIILGGAATRYFSHEGMLHLREGETTHRYLSSDNTLSLTVDNNTEERTIKLSPYAFNHHSISCEDIKVSISNYQTGVEKTLEATPNGQGYLKLMIIQNFHSETSIIGQGEVIHVGKQTVGFSATTQNPTVSIQNTDNKLSIKSDASIRVRTMSKDHLSDNTIKHELPLFPKRVYQIDDLQIVLMDYVPSGRIKAKRSQNGMYTAVDATISTKQMSKEVTLFNITGLPLSQQNFLIGSHNIQIGLGQKERTLPFDLKLKDFILERYNGSNSPAAYRSIMELNDTKNNLHKEVEISMNNTLHHQRYRFYQTSYDQDEKGTILTVNTDYWGTLITYLGYFLMILGMLLALFTPNSRFQKLLKRSVAPVLLLITLLSSPLSSKASNSKEDVIEDFSKIWVQSHDGRIKPISTLSNDFLRKVMWKTSYKGKQPEEVLFGIMANPQAWSQENIIKVTPYIAGLINVDKKYANYQDFFDTQTHRYKLIELVNQAYQKAPNQRHQKDKDVIKIDERVNIFNLARTQSLLKTFPSKENVHSLWKAPTDFTDKAAKPEQLFLRGIWDLIIKEYQNNNYDKAIYYLNSITTYQKKNYNDLPSEMMNKLERRYTKSNIFLKIFPLYLILGFVFLFICFIKILGNSPYTKRFEIVLFSLLLIPFLLHTVGMVMRGIISGHMPWSNGYESMLYVAWTMMLAGLIFARKNPIIISGAAFLTGITLFVAHLSWMNPEITFLVPVLKSHWLTFHVAIITASYGFIGISMFIGIVNMILSLMTNSRNQDRIRQTIQQLTDINEASMILGLYLLTIGTFLGGIWANEAWGRYWGWDPKETWSLVTIIVYSFVTHMRMIPAFKGVFAFNVASIFSFSSILMTYLGVNYYLTGLHSYGSGEAGNISYYSLLAVLFLVVICVMAHKKYRKFHTNP
ncbi:cytochrome c biogenesis protein CcsA [Halosquirtibacter xylanolyticus]|uniref:cytochrome c biogenesis protein n=1 Tax=Halosquirtibacter xylanolyticus TaxID=3374599 RepID=UPI003748B3BD|nr:cytochrome c biogenesis protein CcsA [Prolixibacteraceae bacterium]